MAPGTGLRLCPRQQARWGSGATAAAQPDRSDAVQWRPRWAPAVVADGRPLRSTTVLGVW